MKKHEIINADVTEAYAPYLCYPLETHLRIDSVFTAFFAHMAHGYSSDGETHDFYELIYVDSGEINVEIEDGPEKSVFKLKQGNLYLHAKNHYHRHCVTGQTKNSVCIISFNSENSHVLSLVEEQIIHLTRRQKEYLSDAMRCASGIFKEIVEEDRRFLLLKRDGYYTFLDQIFKNSIELLFLDIVREDVTQNENGIIHGDSMILKDKANEQTIENVKLFLKQNIFKKVKIADICNQFSYSRTTLCIKFKADTGMSIIDYFNHIKIEQSVEMIENSSLSLTMIASRLNFSSYQYFSKVFKDCNGIYPREYKKSIKQKENVRLLQRQNDTALKRE